MMSSNPRGGVFGRGDLCDQVPSVVVGMPDPRSLLECGYVQRGWVCPGGGYPPAGYGILAAVITCTVGKRVVPILLECFLVVD